MNITEHEELLKSLLLGWKNLKVLNTLKEVAPTFEGSELTSLHTIPRAEDRTLVIIKSNMYQAYLNQLKIWQTVSNIKLIFLFFKMSNNKG